MSFKRRRSLGKQLVIDVIMWVFIAVTILAALKFFGVTS